VLIPATLILHYQPYLLKLNQLFQYYEAGAKAIHDRIKNDNNIIKTKAFDMLLKANGLNGV
jgi:hypothetical protein